MLQWTNEVQSQLSKPTLKNSGETLLVSPEKNIVSLQFSEPMQQVENFDLILKFSQWDSESININASNKLKWEKNGQSLSFEIKLPEKERYFLMLNWWGVEKPLISKKGITLQATSGFIVKTKATQNKG